MLTLKGLPVAELLCAGEAPGDGAIPSLQPGAGSRGVPVPVAASGSLGRAGWFSSCTIYENTLG